MGCECQGTDGRGQAGPPTGDVSVCSCSVTSDLTTDRGSLGSGCCEPRGDGHVPAGLRAGQPWTTRQDRASRVIGVDT